jgi:OpgC protein
MQFEPTYRTGKIRHNGGFCSTHLWREIRVMTAVVPTERDWRVDLFRGLAIWLLFLDQLPSTSVRLLAIRSYGFSDASEIIVFAFGYTAGLVYGAMMRERGFGKHALTATTLTIPRCPYSSEWAIEVGQMPFPEASEYTILEPRKQRRTS